MSSIQLQLLGQFQLQRGDGAGVAIAQPRLQALLAYLALHRSAPQARQHLAFLFWPDSSESQARTNLRRLLYEARAALPDLDHFVISHHQWLQWRPEAGLKVDANDFEERLTQAGRLLQSQEIAAAITGFEQALELYHGPFLRDCYDEWTLSTRALLEERYTYALQRLIDLHEEQRAYEQAIASAQRLLRHDPLSESAYQRLMRLHALKGDRASALRLYHECVAMLARELDVAPSAETRAAHAQLLNAAVHGLDYAPDPMTPQRAASQKLVGRQKEWQRLLLAWEHAAGGHAEVVALTGEAGIGKTRLAEEFAAWLQRQGIRCAHSRAYQAQEALAYAPIIELLRGEPARSQIGQMSQVWLAAIARLLPEWRERMGPTAVTDQADELAQRQHFYEALSRALLGEPSAARPLLLLLDDMQWCDRETLEWLRYLLYFAPDAPLLVLMTVRSGEVESEHPLNSFLLALRSQQLLTEIGPARLSREETATLATQVGGRALAAEQAARLYAKSEGNPFFVVEMMRAGIARWSAGAAPGAGGGEVEAEGALPDRVQAVLLARLIQLTPQAQEAAQLAATIGHSFSLALLARAGGYGDDALVGVLDELWQRHLVAERGANEYDFSHPLLREVAYRQISPLRRRLFHRRIAQSLAALSASEVESVSAQMALHYEAAGDSEEAINAYQRGAHFAKQTYAYIDTATLLRKAIALLEALPKSQARHNQSIELYLQLGWALMIGQRELDQQAQQVFDHALALCKASQQQSENGAEPEITPGLPVSAGQGKEVAQEEMHDFHGRVAEAFWGLREIYLFRGNHEKALEASNHCLYFASRSNDPQLLLLAHHILCGIYIYFYAVPHSLQVVLEHTQKCIELYSPTWQRSHLLRFGGHDPVTLAYRLRSRAQWLLGYPDQALATIRTGLALADKLQHPITTRLVLISAAKTHYYRGEAAATLDYIEQALQINDDQSSRGVHIDDVVMRGWAFAQLGRAAEVMASVQEACERRLAGGAYMEMPFYLARSAEIYGCGGKIEAAQSTVEQALALVAQTGEDHWRSELHRLAGRYHLAAANPEAAESSFLHALALAQAQGIKSLELRTALDLCPLWLATGQQDRAYELLAELYGWFTEGFDTADLRAAQALLQRIAPPVTPS